MLLLLRVCRATNCQGGPFLAAHWDETTPWWNVCLWIEHGLKGCMWARFPTVSYAMPKGHSHCHSTFVGMVDSQAPQFGSGSPSGHSTQSMSSQHHPPSHHLVCQLRVPNWCVKPAVRGGCVWPSYIGEPATRAPKIPPLTIYPIQPASLTILMQISDM